jgi:predicted outer membrane protein
VACYLRHALAAGALLFAAAAGAQPAAPTAAAPHMLTIATTSCVFSIHK